MTVCDADTLCDCMTMDDCVTVSLWEPSTMNLELVCGCDQFCSYV